jgi:hypothetical protein
MIPESYQAGTVRLYKARHFPHAWTYVATLLTGPYFADASLFRSGNQWWLFTDTSPDMAHHTLRLYGADDLTGPWTEHLESPIIAQNPHIARPAGRVVVDHNRILRYTQDCYPTYGTQVRAFDITTLTTTAYHERAYTGNPVLAGSGTGWNASGMHHLDPHRLDDGTWIACVDGFCWRETSPGISWST